MKYFPKTAYWRPLVHNAESLDDTTNPHFKNPRAPSVAENEADFVLVLKSNMLHFPCVHSNLKKYEGHCE